MLTKPKGTYDLVGIDAVVYQYIENEIKTLMTNYNYEYIRTPIIESTALFHRSIGQTTTIVTKETYDLKDRGGRNLTLRPEGTAGIVRSVIENKLYGNRNDALKYYYLGTMYRYERPQAGRTREFTQFGIEVFNSDDMVIDAEVISLGFNFLKSLGIEDVTVQLNSLGDQTTRNNYIKAFKTYLKPYLKQLCPDCQTRFTSNPLRILDCKVPTCQQLNQKAPQITDYLSPEAKLKFNQLQTMLRALDIDYEINNRIVRGLDYYDYDVWEYITDDKITLGGGGRYNKLIADLDGPNLPAVGLAFGIERISAELKAKLKPQQIYHEIDAYIMWISEEEKFNAVMIAQNLRLNNIITEINNTHLNLQSQFKIADRLHAKFLLILNNNDLSKGLIKVKDNATKIETEVAETEIVDWLLANI